MNNILSIERKNNAVDVTYEFWDSKEEEWAERQMTINYDGFNIIIEAIKDLTNEFIAECWQVYQEVIGIDQRYPRNYEYNFIHREYHFDSIDADGDIVIKEQKYDYNETHVIRLEDILNGTALATERLRMEKYMKDKRAEIENRTKAQNANRYNEYLKLKKEFEGVI